MKRMIANLSALGLMLCICGWSGASAKTNGPALLETGSPAAARPDPEPRTVKIVTFNIRHVGGEKLTELGDLLVSDPELAGAELIGLQEVDRAKRRTGQVNTARILAQRLGMYYAWAGQPFRSEDDDEEDTGIALLSTFPLADVERVELPHAGPNGRRRVAFGATVVVAGSAVRVYVVHAERRIPTDQHLDQYRRGRRGAVLTQGWRSRGSAGRPQQPPVRRRDRGVLWDRGVCVRGPGGRADVPGVAREVPARLDLVARGLATTGGGVVRRTRLRSLPVDDGVAHIVLSAVAQAPTELTPNDPPRPHCTLGPERYRAQLETTVRIQRHDVRARRRPYGTSIGTVSRYIT